MKQLLVIDWKYFFLSASLGLFTCLWSSSQAAEISFSENSGQVFVSGSGFTDPKQGSYQVNFYVDEKLVGHTQTQMGFFSGSISAGSEKHVEISVLNYRGSGEHYVRKYTVPQTISPKKIRDYADQQARTVANRISNTYGKLENWRYNFSEGFWAGFAGFNVGSSTSDYESGRAEGVSWGQQNGSEAGESEGRQQGRTLGNREARNRFTAVVDTGRSPNLKLSLTEPRYSGQEPALPEVSLEGALAELNEKLQSEMANLTWEYDGYSLSYSSLSDPWSIQRVYGYGGSGKYQFIDSWFRNDYALSEWKNNRLGGRYDSALYQKLDFHQQNQFENDFQESYRNVIEAKFWKASKELNPAAQALGVGYGAAAARKLAHQQGFRAGSLETFRNASIQGFFREYRTSFTSAFNQTVDYYQTHPVLHLDDVKIVDGNRNGFFENGEEISLQIGKLVNEGRVDTEKMEIRVSGDGIVPAAKPVTVSVTKSASQSMLLVPSIGKTPPIEIDTNYTVQVSVGGVSTRVSYQLTWEQILVLFGTKEQGTEIFANYQKYILHMLSNDWRHTLKVGGDPYKRATAETLLGRLVLFYQSGGNQRAHDYLRDLSSDIYRIQETGGGMHPFVRKAYRKLAAKIR